MARKPKSIVLFARKWRDRNGNTYHSVSVVVDGHQVSCPGVHYGYGTAYYATAAECLQKAGYLPGYNPARSLSWYCSNRDIAFHAEDLYVCKRADL